MTNVNETLKVETNELGRTVITVTVTKGGARAVVKHRTTQSGIKQHTAAARTTALKNLELMTEA